MSAANSEFALRAERTSEMFWNTSLLVAPGVVDVTPSLMLPRVLRRGVYTEDFIAFISCSRALASVSEGCSPKLHT
jgi:hypothetical protein